MKTLNKAPAAQSGFTLAEVLVVLVVLALLAGVGISIFSGDRSKATVLYTTMTEASSAMSRLKADVSCYPAQTGTLMSKGAGFTEAGDMLCGIDVSNQWRGPYVKPFELDGSNNILINNIVPNATLSIEQNDVDTNGNGSTREWVIRANGVPEDIIAEAVKQCNGNEVTDVDPTAYTNMRCVRDADTSMYYIFDERV